MIKFDIYNGGKFIIIKYSGIIDRDFIISFMGFIYSNINKEILEKALIDFRDAEIAFSLDDLKDMMELRVKYSNGFEHSLRSVYLVKEAKETAFTTLYARSLPMSIINLSICSTIAYAIRLLGLSLSVSDVENRINSLSDIFDKNNVSDNRLTEI